MRACHFGRFDGSSFSLSSSSSSFMSLCVCADYIILAQLERVIFVVWSEKDKDVYE